MGSKTLASILLAVLIAAASSAEAKCNLAEIGLLPVHMEGLDPLVDAKINGRQVQLVADSGAFFSSLNSEEAEKLKLKELPIRMIYLQGAGGVTAAKIQTAQDFSVLDHTFKDVDFVAMPEYFGRGVSGLLGQNVLNFTDAEYDLSNGVIRLFHPDDCKDVMLAYWDQGAPYSVIPIRRLTRERRQIIGHVSVNGVDIAAEFDTGTPYSILTLKGAARAGIKKGDPRLKPGGVSGGIGRRLNQTWIAPVDSFKIGDEEIRQTGLRVAEMELPEVDMLIGADFFLSHHIFVANSQEKLYLTYNGGPVFKLDAIPEGDGKAAAPAGAPPAIPATDAGQDPKDADGFARRAEAFAARRDYARAFADFDRALALAPKDPRILFARGRIHEAQKQSKLAFADYDEALKQKPADVDMLMTRGELRLHDKQLGPAKADFEAVKFRDPDRSTSVAAAYAAEAYYPEAVAEYDAILADTKKSDDKASALDGRCLVRAEWDHDLELALKDCQDALHIETGSRGILFTRAFLYLRMGRNADAVHDLDLVIHSQPKLALAIYYRGVAKIRSGKAAEGKADIDAALAISPKVGETAKKYGLSPEPAAKP